MKSLAVMTLNGAIILLGILAECTAQAQLTTNDCDSCIITRTEQFEGAALTGYINGGAELYREYGFTRLTVQEVRLRSGEELVVESYRMRSPSVAYGIFSISRNHCGEPDTAFTYSCSGPYQIQCAAGEMYLRILNGTGSPQAQASSRTLLRALARHAGQPALPMPAFFAAPPVSAVRDRMALITGPLGVQNGLPDWGDLLDGLEGFVLHAARLSDERGLLAELRCANDEDAGRVAQRLGVPVSVGTLLEPTRGMRGYLVWRSPVVLRLLDTTSPRASLEEFLHLLVSGDE